MITITLIRNRKTCTKARSNNTMRGLWSAKKSRKQKGEILSTSAINVSTKWTIACFKNAVLAASTCVYRAFRKSVVYEALREPNSYRGFVRFAIKLANAKNAKEKYWKLHKPPKIAISKINSSKKSNYRKELVYHNKLKKAL